MRNVYPCKTVVRCAVIFGLCLAAACLGRGEEVQWPCRCEPDRVLDLHQPSLPGGDVLELQTTLLRQGIDPGPLDGIYGKQTEAALREFQQRATVKAQMLSDRLTHEVLGKNEPSTARQGSGLAKCEVVIDVGLTVLYLVQWGQITASYPVALGKPGRPTPLGNYKIISKAAWGEGFGTRWLGLDVPFGVYGIHGTNKPWTIGGYESSGCIRMFNNDVEKLYEQVSVGTHVHIIGDPFYATEELGPGDKGVPVLYLQRRMRQVGYGIKVDGFYSVELEKAIMTLQKKHGLKETGVVGPMEFEVLRLRAVDY